MGLFTRKGKRGKHGPKKTAKERELLLNVRYLESLKASSDPDDKAEYKAIMADRLGRKKAKDKGEIAQFVEMAGLLQDAGMIQNPADVGQGFSLKDVFRGLGELGKSAPAIIESVRGGGQQEAVYEQPSDGVPQIEAPRKLVPMSLVSRFLVAQVKNPITQKMKTPSQVADMLLEHYDDASLPMVRELVDGFCQTPNEEMGNFISAFATRHPDLHGFLAWMEHAERRKWFGECILAVRAKMGGAGQQAATENMGI